MMFFKEWRNKKKEKQEQDEKEMLRRIENREPPRTVTEVAVGIAIRNIVKPRVVICPQAIVSYVPLNKPDIEIMAGNLFAPESLAATDNKIKEILAANPGVDLKGYETALGITVERVDRISKEQV